MLRDKYFFVMVGTRAILVSYSVIITTMVISSGKDFTGRFCYSSTCPSEKSLMPRLKYVEIKARTRQKSLYTLKKLS